MLRTRTISTLIAIATSLGVCHANYTIESFEISAFSGTNNATYSSGQSGLTHYLSGYWQESVPKSGVGVDFLKNDTGTAIATYAGTIRWTGTNPPTDTTIQVNLKEYAQGYASNALDSPYGLSLNPTFIGGSFSITNALVSCWVGSSFDGGPENAHYSSWDSIGPSTHYITLYDPSYYEPTPDEEIQSTEELIVDQLISITLSETSPGVWTGSFSLQHSQMLSGMFGRFTATPSSGFINYTASWGGFGFLMSKRAELDYVVDDYGTYYL